MTNETRFTGAGCTELSDAVIRAMSLPGGLTMENLREPGFRMMQQYVESDGFRALAPLPENAQKVIDKAVVEVGLERLTVMADVMAAGLTYNLTDPLSITQLEWLASNKVGNGQRSMSPDTRQENFLPDLLAHRLPIYLTTSGFSLDIRTLRMSQRIGLPLDTANIKSGTRVVNELLEDAMINGATTLDGQDLTVAGYTAPGLLNAPHAETQSLTAAAWSTAPVGSTVFAQVQLMIAKLVANKKFGPYRLYLPTGVGAALSTDYSSSKGDNTIRDRILKIEGLQAIKTADLLPATKVVLVQMTSDVLDVVVGQSPTVIPYTSLNGMVFHNLIMAIMVPRIKWDYNLKSGIVIGTLA
jgi:Family of unknown function (DUF6260)